MNKKLFSLILCLVLAISLLTVPAGASGGNETEIILGAHVESVTPTTITVKAIGGVKYRINGGAWTSNPVFSGLYPNTAYQIEAHYTTTGSINNLGTFTTKASESHTARTYIDEAAVDKLAYTGYSAAFSLDNDLTLYLYLRANKYTGYENYRIYFSQKKNERGTSVYNWINRVISAAPDTVEYNGVSCYVFKIPGIAAAEVADELNVTLYADNTSTHKTAVAQIFTTSLKDIAGTIFSSSSDNKEKTLVADFLNYCAEAQTYFSYNTTTMANTLSGLSSFATQSNPTLTHLNEKQELSGASVTFDGYNLEVGSKITWKILFHCDPSTVNVSALRLKATYTAASGRTVTLSVAPTGNGTSGSYFALNQIAAADFGTPITFHVELNGTTVSATRRSHIESTASNYAASAGNAAIINAMMKYSNSAKAYFSR